MTRSSNVLPKNRVPIEVGVKLFCQWQEQPCPLLGGLAPRELFKGPFLDVDRIWFTGSCAWMPLVQGKMFDNKTDIDVCLPDRDQAMALRDHVVAILTKVVGGAPQRVVEGLEENRFGGPKMFWTKPQKVGKPEIIEPTCFMDIFWPPPERTIAEVISGFEGDWERVAVRADVQPGEVSSVIRLTYPWKHDIYSSEHKAECHACKVKYADVNRFNDGS